MTKLAESLLKFDATPRTAEARRVCHTLSTTVERLAGIGGWIGTSATIN